MWRYAILIAVAPFVALSGCVPATGVQEYSQSVRIPLNLAVWKLDFEAFEENQVGVYWIKEYVRGDESVYNWSELLTFQFLPVSEGGVRDPLMWALSVLSNLEEDCSNGFAADVLEANYTLALYEWSYKDCASAVPGTFDQHELAVFLRGDDGMHAVHYVVTGRIGSGDRNRWIGILLEARLE
jgi:hypothetical protein